MGATDIPGSDKFNLTAHNALTFIVPAGLRGRCGLWVGKDWRRVSNTIRMCRTVNVHQGGARQKKEDCSKFQGFCEGFLKTCSGSGLQSSYLRNPGNHCLSFPPFLPHFLPVSKKHWHISFAPILYENADWYVYRIFFKQGAQVAIIWFIKPLCICKIINHYRSYHFQRMISIITLFRRMMWRKKFLSFIQLTNGSTGTYYHLADVGRDLQWRVLATNLYM